MARKGMTTQSALKEAKRRWGKTAAVRDNGPKYVSSPEKRAQASSQLKTFRESLPEKATRTKEQKAEVDRLFFEMMRHRYTVGHIQLGMFFHVEAEGDTWELAFKEVDDKAARWKEADAARKAA